MHAIIILAVMGLLICFMPRLALGLIFLGGILIFFGFILNPRGNLAPHLIEKYGLDKPAAASQGPAPSPTADGPVAIKPLPPRRVN